MSAKAILDVALNGAEKMERFGALFKQYEEKLAKTPGIWSKVSKEHAAMAQQFQKMTAGLMAQNQLARESAEARSKEAKTVAGSARLWTEMSKSTKSVASNIAGATRNLLQWTGILSTVGGLLGGIGISSLADRVGEQKAFQLNFGRLVDPDSFLGMISDMQTDPSKSGGFYSLGVDPNGSTSAVAVNMLKAMRALAKSTDTQYLGLLDQQYGLSASTEDWRRLKTGSDAEFNQQVDAYGRDKGGLGISDSTARKWVDFTNQMERAGNQIFNTFVVGMLPLRRPLMDLSSAFAHTVEVFLRSDLVKEGIAKLGKWLEELATNIESKKFQESLQQLFSDGGWLGTSVHAIATQLGQLAEDLPNIVDTVHLIAHPGETFDKARAALAPTSKDIAKYPGALAIAMKNTAENFGLPRGLLETVKTLESGGAADAISAKGALGMFQLMPATARAYGVENPFDPVQNMTGAAGFLQHLKGKYKGDMAEVLAANNMGETKFDKVLAKYGSNWMAGVPAETKQYVMNGAPMLQAYGINITINAPPGFSAAVAGSQLAR
jgi:hypothetical protein